MRIEKYPVNIPEKLNDVVHEKLEIIYKNQKKKRMKNCAAAMGAAAAVFAVATITCVTNPVMASKLPLIGHIFEQMQGKIAYSGDYSETAVSVIDSEKDRSQGKDKAVCTKKDGDLTMTISEVYCNSQALSLGLMLESEKGFPDTARSAENDMPLVTLEMDQTYSFTPTPFLQCAADPDGDFVDEHTYIGVLRIPLRGSKDIDETAYEEALRAGKDADYDALVKTVDIPEEFQVHLKFTRLIGDRAAYDPEEQEEEISASVLDMEDIREEDIYPNTQANYWYDGAWEFDFSVCRNDSQTVTVDIRDTNAYGIGLSRVTKTPYEITMYPNEKTAQLWEELYIPVVLDAEGRFMGCFETIPVGSHDVSHVDVYIIKDSLWRDEIVPLYRIRDFPAEGEETAEGKTLKEFCGENSLHHTAVDFPEKNE
ncbi:MAG TPA: hypothetical protein DF613_05930 [Lachnospiraceae bacterium]|nr:hypothetical protein [Lachnospiraceae bacterium]